MIERDRSVLSAQRPSDTPQRTFPRVLIVYKSRINAEDGFNVSLRGCFREWPTKQLAQIYSGGVVGEGASAETNSLSDPRNAFLVGSSLGSKVVRWIKITSFAGQAVRQQGLHT